ncbi:MAG: hypothetical protein KDI36_03030 [Pseudomonadales bacterium]|nr:hypothetical protein [Pseudomonadales bacterium]
MTENRRFTSKPNRRVRGQRRHGNGDRRQKNLHVVLCRRRNQADRRYQNDRRNAVTTTLLNASTMPTVRRTLIIATEPLNHLGRYIDIAV